MKKPNREGRVWHQFGSHWKTWQWKSPTEKAGFDTSLEVTGRPDNEKAPQRRQGLTPVWKSLEDLTMKKPNREGRVWHQFGSHWKTWQWKSPIGKAGFDTSLEVTGRPDSEKAKAGFDPRSAALKAEALPPGPSGSVQQDHHFTVLTATLGDSWETRFRAHGPFQSSTLPSWTKTVSEVSLPALSHGLSAVTWLGTTPWHNFHWLMVQPIR